MADPALHIKDAYYFEVPKFLWRYEFKSESEIPKSLQFLRKAHPPSEISLAEFNKDLSGKIIIPQPFDAKLKNLHEKESGFAISKFMVIELVVAIIVAVIFIRLAGKVSNGNAPKGRFANMFEAILIYLRDNVARPAIGGHDADKFVPLLWTLFFFVLVCNLMGLVPWAGSPTASFGATFGLACITFGTVLISGMVKFGPIGFWFNQVPHMDLPLLLRPLKLVIFAIEVLGMCIKHAILAVRLLANMVAGHLVLLGVMGLIVIAAKASTAQWGLVTTISVLGCTAFSCLELFVALLQAYIFTFLSALFIGAAVHHH